MQDPSRELQGPAAAGGDATTSIPVQEIKEHVTCGLCLGPLAHSLVLSCSHLFCGDCLLKRLQVDMNSRHQACPTCNMDLRAVPVRCLAMDRVAAAIVGSLPREQQQQYAKRTKDGAIAADQINKMLWWLTPPSAVGGGAPGAAPAMLPGSSSGMLGGGGGLVNNLGLAAAAASGPMQLLGGVGHHASLDAKGSSALPGMHHQLQPFGLPPFGGLGGPAGGLGPAHLPPAAQHSASFLQMALAAQLAQQQAAKVQQQLGAAAAAAGLAPHHRHQHQHQQQHGGGPAGMLPDNMVGLQHMLSLGAAQDRGAAGPPGPAGMPPLGHLPPATPSPTGYHPDQLSSLISSICNV